jgi:hypothetical protein
MNRPQNEPYFVGGSGRAPTSRCRTPTASLLPGHRPCPLGYLIDRRAVPADRHHDLPGPVPAGGKIVVRTASTRCCVITDSAVATVDPTDDLPALCDTLWCGVLSSWTRACCPAIPTLRGHRYSETMEEVQESSARSSPHAAGLQRERRLSTSAADGDNRQRHRCPTLHRRRWVGPEANPPIHRHKISFNNLPSARRWIFTLAGDLVETLLPRIRTGTTTGIHQPERAGHRVEDPLFGGVPWVPRSVSSWW